jgi:Photosynthesis system II assembly factor YCF48/Putative zinc-finger
MAPDDREQLFEKALARHLRGNKPALQGTPAQLCPDPEILAAYHERELPPEQIAFFEKHISSCARCQEALSYLQSTEPLSVDSTAQTKDGAPAEREPSVIPIARPRHARLWLWAAPAGAIAAGLLVWLALHEKPRQFEMAKNQPPVSLSPTIPRPESAPAAPQPLASKNAPAAKGLREQSSSPVRTFDATDALSQRAGTLHEPKPLHPSPALKDQRDDNAFFASNPATSTAESPALVGGAAGAISNRLESSRKKQAAPIPPPPPAARESVEVSADAVELAPQAPAAQSLAKTNSGASSSDLQSRQNQQVEQVGGMSRFRQSEMVLLANIKSPVIVLTPNKKVSWRVGHAGSIERTQDSGATWSIQASGVVTDLLAGSAPSDSVCWLVGRLGTVLRTDDSGTTWTKLQSPVTEDLVSVFAVNSRQATISSAHDSYLTTDGAVTWTKLPPE